MMANRFPCSPIPDVPDHEVSAFDRSAGAQLHYFPVSAVALGTSECEDFVGVGRIPPCPRPLHPDNEG